VDVVKYFLMEAFSVLLESADDSRAVVDITLLNKEE
jgi:hypothetical protein